jgi:pantoate--beta-alanine ligase
MQVAKTITEIRALVAQARATGKRIGFVPTMGALHAGHVSLIEAAAAKCRYVVVSIFVNPTQFGPGEDFAKYPRPLEKDLAICREHRVDAVFAPSAAEMYPVENLTWVTVETLTAPLCGRSRPGHFRGVATVVAKLLVAAKPHVAVFGEKDFQQLALIRRLARDLGFDVAVVGVPTVREPDGLALSSRNVHLSREARPQALALVRALGAADAAVAAGERSRRRLLHLVREEIAKAPLATLDYAELVDPDSLSPSPERLAGPALLALAVFFPRAVPAGATVRLIDNRVLSPHPEERP